MTGPRFRRGLFRGTAEHYDRFRPPYPPALLADLRRRVPLTARSRVLDLACGTGQVAFAVAADVAEVVAVDQEAEAVAFGARKADRLGVTNIRWITASAEDVELPGRFDLVAIGNAFHRLERDRVAARLVPSLVEGGCVALLWGGTPWNGDEPWQRVLDATIERWRDELGVRDRVPAGWDTAIERDPHAAVLRRAGLSVEGELSFQVRHEWTVESLIGFVYSTSVLNQTVLGDRAPEFEAELRAGLLACRADGVFDQQLSFAYELARREDADA